MKSHPRVFIAAAAFSLVLLAAPIAQAFTIDDQSNTNPNGSAKFSDPDSRFSGTGNGGPTTYRQGNMSLQIGPQRSLTDERYNNERMFNPNGRPGDDR